jgi:hypothetical protein
LDFAVHADGGSDGEITFGDFAAGCLREIVRPEEGIGDPPVNMNDAHNVHDVVVGAPQLISPDEGVEKCSEEESQTLHGTSCVLGHEP